MALSIPEGNLQRLSETQVFEGVSAFLNRYKRWSEGQRQTYPVVAKFLHTFTAQLVELKRGEENWETEAAPYFNVFRALRIERRETKLHSRFIAELLNPRGSHSQGDLFLRGFLKIASERGLRPPIEPWKEWSWQVTTEEAINEFGRLDIVLRCGNPRFIAVIENKVDAREQTDQCCDYSKWLSAQTDFKLQERIFLTPDGHSPKTDTSRQWVCLSYREHVRNWLEDTMRKREIHAPHLRLAIEQYLRTIETL